MKSRTSSSKALNKSVTTLIKLEANTGITTTITTATNRTRTKTTLPPTSTHPNRLKTKPERHITHKRATQPHSTNPHQTTGKASRTLRYNSKNTKCNPAAASAARTHPTVSTSKTTTKASPASRLSSKRTMTFLGRIMTTGMFLFY